MDSINYTLFLIISFFLINTVHLYLLTTSKVVGIKSISEYAALTSKSYVVYVLGHLLNGVLIIVFSWEYFLNAMNNEWLFYLSLLTVCFEYLQAIIPAKGKYDSYHTVAAILMWASFISLGGLSIVLLPVSSSRVAVASITYLCIFLMLLYGIRHRNKLYLWQMIAVNLFYLSMLILVA